MAVVRRALGAVSRRLGRPELLSAFYPLARRDEHESIAITAILAGALRRGSSFVDIGTNRGQLLRTAVRVAPDGRHLAFEPIPELAAELEREFPSVDCRRLALGATPGEARFCHFRALDGWSGLRRSPEISDERGRPEYIDVRVSTLDEEIGEIVPGIVKIDVEGAELDVLRGAARVLDALRPLLILEHVPAAAALYQATSGQVWDQLDAARYELFTVTGEGPVARADFGSSAQVVNWLARPAG